jgi:hypothetical protein
MTRRAACTALLALTITGLATPPGALADGDPASDVLLGQAVFLGYGNVSHAAGDRLYAVASSAAAHGYPIRVAVIGARTDLGTVPALFGKPATYASFLSQEVPGTDPILVVMPAGLGLARSGHALPMGSLGGISTGSHTPDALAAAGVTAVERLSAAAGHPLPANAASGSTQGGASGGTIARALGAIAVMALLAGLGAAGAWRARGRAARAG